jgi:hypothetical protein
LSDVANDEKSAESPSTLSRSLRKWDVDEDESWSRFYETVSAVIKGLFLIWSYLSL